MSAEYIFISLSISLLLTLILELLFALVFRIRGRTLIVVSLVNVLTNPVLVVLFLLLCRHFPLPAIAVLPILEICAFLTEAFIYKAGCSDIRRPFLFSLGANVFSYLSGVLISTLI